MNEKTFSTHLSLRKVKVTDTFWKKKMELIREQVIPYQWKALNDKIAGAVPSYCMRNFKIAAEKNKQRKACRTTFQEPRYTVNGWESLPEDPEHLEDKFYGFVFQDSDFYKWIEAVGYSLVQHPDSELEKIADEAIDIVCEAQQEDGYLDTLYILSRKDKIFTNIKDNHELYCLGHLLEGAIAYYQATGKDKLLRAAKRYADFVDENFGPEKEKRKGYPGHEIAEMALVRLFEITNEQKYLNLAKFFVDERGRQPYYFDLEHPEEVKKHPGELRYEYNQAHLPVRQQEEAVGHAVRAVYLYSGMADVARLTTDEGLWKACEKIWNNIVNKKMYITGGIGGTHVGEAFSYNYDLPNDTAYSETCASIGLVFQARRMLEIQADSKYADVMERALYNCVLSGMDLQGKCFFYVNPLEVNPEACHKDERKFHVKTVRQKWFGCACCPPNLARMLSSVSSYAYTERDDILYVHLYMGSVVEKDINEKKAKITINSGFPWNGNVSVSVEAVEELLTLAFRIPEWGREYTLQWENRSGDADTWTENGYLYIRKVWKEKECLKIDFPMNIRFIQANLNVREDIGKIAVTRGPIVYCLEEADNDKNLHLLTIDCKNPCKAERRIIGGETIWAITARGYRQELMNEENCLYYPACKEKKTPVDLHFIPYYIWANRGENEMSVWVRRE